MCTAALDQRSVAISASATADSNPVGAGFRSANGSPSNIVHANTAALAIKVADTFAEQK